MIIRTVATLLTSAGMMFVVRVAENHGDWKIFGAAVAFGIGAFLMGEVD